jgi:cell division protein ZapA
MLKKRYDITILGQELAVLSDAGSEQVANVVQFVNEKMEDIARSSDGLRTLDVAILAALNITEDFFKLKGVNQDLREHLTHRSEKLIQLIENAS